MAKIKSINISGIRGIKDPLTLDLDKKSVLIYGDNGAGKSSVTDAFEWFFFDQVDHLSNEEIGRRKGRDALRNIFIPDSEDGYIELKFDDSKLDTKKSIDSSLKPSSSNVSDEFNEFIVTAQSENLILRYRDLVQFIIAGKTDKLNELQKIIGFSEVANIRSLLKKNAGRIARNIKSANYDNLKSIQQSNIIENLGQPAYNDEQLFESVNNLIIPLKLGIEIKSRKDINTVLKKIQTKEDTALLKKISFFTRIWETLSEVEGNVDNIHKSYKKYQKAFKELQKDPEKIKKLQLLALLKEGHTVLKNDVIQDDYCPLCLQEKSKVQLVQELTNRIEELEQLAEEKSELDELGDELEDLLRPNLNTIDSLLKEKLLKNEENAILKNQIEKIKNSLTAFNDELKKDFSKALEGVNKIEINVKELAKLIKHSHETGKSLKESQSANIKFHVYTKLLQASHAYIEYQRIEKEQEILSNQQFTLEALYADFVKRQEEALNVFLTIFSQNINEYYTIMNPNEKVEDIKLVPLKKNDELVGVTIEYSFFSKIRTQPVAYLSESHINCIGLSFFLASVKAFNKKNKFFILDDVISSFDRAHRYRFAQLLPDKFSDYQVLLLTHEKEFFELVSSEVKSKGWVLNNFKWTKEQGTGIEKGLADIKERIKKKLVDKNTDGLGNDIRIYTEKVMKRVALEIEAKVAYRNNDVNEKRMAPELLDAVQSKLSKASKELKDVADIPKIKGMPMFVGNTTSHDNEFQESIEDLDAMWENVKKTIHCFYCPTCNKFVSLKFYDTVEKKIRCGCAKLKYDWKN